MMLDTFVRSTRVLREFKESTRDKAPDAQAVDLASALEDLLFGVVSRDPHLAEVYDREMYAQAGGVDCNNCGRAQTYLMGEGCVACGFFDDDQVPE